MFLIAVECNHREENMPTVINHSVYYKLFEKAENAQFFELGFLIHVKLLP